MSATEEPSPAPQTPSDTPAPSPALTKAGKRKHIRTGKRPPLPPPGTVPLSDADHPLNLDAYRENAIRQYFGEPKTLASNATDLTRRQSRRIGEICGVSIEEFRETTRKDAQAILNLINSMALEDIPKLSPFQRQLTYGIRMDKWRDLTGGQAPTTVHQTNIQINGADRATALAALAGKGAGIAGMALPAANTRTIEVPAMSQPEYAVSEDTAQAPANRAETSGDA